VPPPLGEGRERDVARRDAGHGRRRTLKDVLEPEKTVPKKKGREKKGEGIGALPKLAAKELSPISIDATSNFAKDEVSGMGIKKKRGRKPGKVTTGQLLGMAKQFKKMGRKNGGKLEPMLYNVGPAKSH
jgi:hypothetical protein